MGAGFVETVAVYAAFRANAIHFWQRGMEIHASDRSG
jgi:hypothetical protein